MKLIYLYLVLFFNSINAVAIELYQNDELTIDLKTRITLQYKNSEKSWEKDSENIEQYSIKNFRPSFSAKYSDKWRFRFDWDFGKGKNEIKNAYLSYHAIPHLDIAVGNQKLPFSRDTMISSRRINSPQRSVLSDKEFGIPSRQPGIHLKTSWLGIAKFYYSYAKANLRGDLLTEIRFVNPWENNSYKEITIDKGEIATWRIDTRVFGRVNYEDVNFKKNGLLISASGYRWKNNGDIKEIQRVMGNEISIALRLYGISLDLQTNNIKAYSPYLLERPLFKLGEADVEQYGMKASYLFYQEKLIIYGQILEMSAESWQYDWLVKEFGVNYLINKNNHKLQLGVRNELNVKGEDNKHHSVFLQWQYRF